MRLIDADKLIANILIKLARELVILEEDSGDPNNHLKRMLEIPMEAIKEAPTVDTSGGVQNEETD